MSELVLSARGTTCASFETGDELDRRSKTDHVDGDAHGSDATSLRRRALGAVALPALAVLVALVGLFLVQRSRASADAAVRHASDVRLAAERVLRLLVDSESGVRGYAATGERRFLEPEERARVELPGALGRLRALVRGEPVQEDLVGELARLSGRELDELDDLRTAATAADGVARAAGVLDAAQHGKETMDALRRTIARLERVEQVEQEKRLGQRRRLDRLVTAATVGAGGMGVLAGIGLAYMVARGESALRQSERRRAATSLSTSEARRRYNELVLASADAGIFTLDHDGRCTSVNRFAAEMLGYGVADLLGVDLHAAIHHHRPDGSLYPHNECPIVGASSSGEPVRVGTECFWRRDGSRLAVEYSVQPLNDNGQSRGRSSP